jgi:hypothetical protein
VSAGFKRFAWIDNREDDDGSDPFAAPTSVIAARVVAIHVFVSAGFKGFAWILATSPRMTVGAVAVLHPPVIAARVAAIVRPWGRFVSQVGVLTM